MSGCVIILTSLDIFLLVKYPTKFKFVKNFKFQMLILLIFFISFCALYSMDWFFVFRSITNYSFLLCAYYLYCCISNSLSFCIFNKYFNFSSVKVKTDIKRNTVKTAKKLFKISLGLDLLFFISNAT